MNQVSATNRQAIGILLLSVLAGAIGQLTLKAAVDRMGEMSLSFQMLLGLATNPFFFHESISWLRLVGCAVIIIGLLIIARGETNLAAEAKAVE